MRIGDALQWVLVCAYGVLWAGGVASRWFPMNTPAPSWAAPAFLLAAAAIAALGAREISPIALFAAGGFAAEWIGVHTGWPFGRYAYTAALGPAMGGVPASIACAWLVLLLFARDVGWRVAGHRWTAVATGAATMTALDLLIDPVATRVLRYWEWRQPGAFYGVPLVNFAGWFAISAMLLALAGKPRKPSAAAAAIGVSVAAFFAIIGLRAAG